jgi:hypothetical protein
MLNVEVKTLYFDIEHWTFDILYPVFNISSFSFNFPT